jgi:hypothetical protein
MKGGGHRRGEIWRQGIWEIRELPINLNQRDIGKPLTIVAVESIFEYLFVGFIHGCRSHKITVVIVEVGHALMADQL